MKILLITQLYWPDDTGGAGRSVRSLAESLVQMRHQVTVLTLARGDHNETADINGVKIRYLAINNSLSHARHPKRTPAVQIGWHLWSAMNPRMAAALRKVLTDEAPDVVHTNILAGFCTRVWRISKELGLPLMHTMRDYYLLCPRGTMFKNGSNCREQCRSCMYYTAGRRRLSRYPDAVIGVSRAVLERHERFGYFSDTTLRDVIHNGYKMESVQPIVPATGGAALRLGFLGRIHPSKGLEVLLSALASLPPDRFTLKIAGTGSPAYLNHLKTDYAVENAHYLGFAPPEELFRQIDLLVVPSLFEEPFGRVIIEAFAHGVPVLASKRGGPAEIIDAGRTGWLFDPDDGPRDLARVLQSLIAAKTTIGQMRDKCLEKAHEFTHARTAAQYVEVYRQIIAAQR